MSKEFYISSLVIDSKTQRCSACGNRAERHTVEEGGRIFLANERCSLGHYTDADDDEPNIVFAWEKTQQLLAAVSVLREGESVKDRVVLAAADGTRFYTHASVVCRSSPKLHNYYHRWEKGSDEAGKEVFDLPEADASTVHVLLKYIYLNSLPAVELQSFTQLMKLANFLRVKDFEEVVAKRVTKFKKQKLLTTEDWINLHGQLLLYEYRTGLALIYEDFVKPNDAEETED